ncbi:small integral membrane protein 26-like [Nomascus leucogenys]|uniref:small integral membrane protein 26-like n=1 Tax=Nomascus leucogenys TaxID=61853 RepID=UPI00122D59C2|nr:small integral membrane protein 26-like [Nomascus leucogenys]
MYQNQFTDWYRWMSVVYGVGTWTLVGSMFYFSRKMTKPSGDDVEQKDVSKSEGPSELSELPKGFYVEMLVTHEDFVPVIDKILNYWKSWTSGPGAEPGLAAEF